MWSGGVGAVEQRLHRRDEILGHGAADAAVRQLEDIIFGAGLVAAALEDVAVDAEITEFVDDERYALAIRVVEQMADEGGLAGAEKAGDDGGGDLLHGKAPETGKAGATGPRQDRSAE